ncbi:hypothetical protein EDB81DRAFT_706866 [Dactylonectria macrodidyma]|uniref:Zn(2)-C6 fungal-type domain-containing protein n=1 Tax=Dactylonectria macrodidyma TaxID=307937 RepID=A0A9P9JRN0_9HYPO|nr:hypothetical protein EDB81DRAFT_706866 [Dactylonectria macrodidyma]
MNRKLPLIRPHIQKQGTTDTNIVRSGPPPRATLAPRRRATAIACSTCRRRKARCDGLRPSCTTCKSRGLSCAYDLDRDRPSPLQKDVETLQIENRRWKELYARIKLLPDADAQIALLHIRTAETPINVLDILKTITNSNPAAGPSFVYFNKQIDTIDREAWLQSELRVTSRPWTAIAGDGIVSQLISSFFAWDDAFLLPFVDRRAFMTDLMAQKPEEAKYCSPFLVNAICASRCYTSKWVKRMDALDGRDLRAEFFAEAERLFELENSRASLPTVQGLAIMFLISTHTAMDRSGVMFRFAAYEMLDRMQLNKVFDKIKEDPTKSTQRRVISKALWGLFCFESMVANLYLTESELSPPTVPRVFELDPKPSQSQPRNVDMFDNPYTSTSEPTADSPPPFVPGILSASCDLCLFLYQAMQMNFNPNIGTGKDLQTRRELYNTALDWRKFHPAHLKFESNPAPQTCFLRLLFDEVLTALLHPLTPSTVFDNGFQVRDLVIRYAHIDTKILEQHLETFPLVDYSCMTLNGLLNAALAVVPHLRETNTHEIFCNATSMLQRSFGDFPFTKFVLLGIKALAWAFKVPLPAEAVQTFQELSTDIELADITLCIAVPPNESVRKLLSMDSNGRSVIEIGDLLTKWRDLSTQDMSRTS